MGFRLRFSRENQSSDQSNPDKAIIVDEINPDAGWG